MSKKLLLADDSVVIQKLVGLSFANEDLEIETTDNGDDAIAKAREIVPDIVLADVVMPGKSGYEVCEAIKRDPKLAHIPVLLLTGTFEAFDEARATAAGSDGQITKPFEAQSLVERVNQVMNAPRPAASASAATPPAEAANDNDYDFFENDVTSLSADEILESDENGADDFLAESNSHDLTPALDVSDLSGGGDVSDDDFFGAPGDGASDELDTQGGGLAIGESVAPRGVAEADATIAMLPSQSVREGDGADPLVGFEDDLGLNEPFALPDAMPPTPVDLDAVLDSPPAVPAAPVARATAQAEATIVSPTPAAPIAPPPIEFNDLDASDDLTVHAPVSASRRDITATSTEKIATAPAATPLPTRPGSETTAVTNLDESLSQPAESQAARAGIRPAAAVPLDLGPASLSPDELDFSFDVSEQRDASEIPDPLAESFSSLMDISESQILGGPPSDPEDDFGSEDADPLMNDSIAAGYDVYSSDLATAAPARTATPTAVISPTSPTPPMPATEGGVDIEASTPGNELELDTPRSTDPLRDRISDLSPMVEQRIQETLEKVAWEAFSDLSESIVKQVIGRVEQIAWQVIPEMAETLVREEIRKMKGDKD